MMHKLRIAAYSLMFVVSSWSAQAADIVLKPECHCGETVVRLSDVADVYDNDEQAAERLSQVELFPTPVAKRYLSIEELKSILMLRAVKVGDCDFSGSSRVVVAPSAAAPVALVSHGIGFNSSRQREAQRRVEDAVLEYLTSRVDDERRWTIEAVVTQEDTEIIAQPFVQLSATGGSAPWTGRQEFDLTVKIRDQIVHRQVVAEVSTPEVVVVTRRPMRSGELVQYADVELLPLPPNSRARQLAYSLDEIVGKELSRGYSQNTPIDPRDTRAPLLVKRNDVVTVYSRAGGVYVRMLGKAMSDGARGDVIAVSDLQTRKPLRSMGVVTGFQTVEIFALGPQAAATESTNGEPSFDGLPNGRRGN